MLSCTSRIARRGIHHSIVNHARNIRPFPVGLEGEWRKGRTKKVIKVELPNFDETRPSNRNKTKPEEYISKLKERGVVPPRKYQEKPVTITSIQGVLDPYVPPEGDGRFTALSKSGALQKATAVKQKTTSMLALRKIRSYEDEFDPPDFAEQALQIYKRVHELLANQSSEGNEEEFMQHVTEFAYPLLKFQTKGKTIKWQFISTNEIPSVVQMRTQSMIDKNNMFAQATVRLNTRQILAIYDRFGHLLHGSDAVVKDVLEFVVFEKNISDYNGKWRLCSKIIPDWLPPKEPIRQTFVRQEAPPPPSEEELKFEKEGILSDEKKNENKDAGNDGGKQLASA